MPARKPGRAMELRLVGKVLVSWPLSINKWLIVLRGHESEGSLQLCHVRRSSELENELYHRRYWMLEAGVVSYTPESGGEP
jgi:hypothetical protein